MKPFHTCPQNVLEHLDGADVQVMDARDDPGARCSFRRLRHQVWALASVLGDQVLRDDLQPQHDRHNIATFYRVITVEARSKEQAVRSDCVTRAVQRTKFEIDAGPSPSDLPGCG